MARTLVLVCPDWDIIASGSSAHEPAAVFFANRVVATSPMARMEGVSVGMRRRQAQRLCPQLVVHEADADRSERIFAQIIGVVDAVTPRVELSSAGRLAFPSQGPSRYVGGDDQLAQQVIALMAEALPDWPQAVGVGIADSYFTALLAAQRAWEKDRPYAVVGAGGAQEFLANFPIDYLRYDAQCDAEFIDIARRLGLKKFSDLAQLRCNDMASRFGNTGVRAWNLVQGNDADSLVMQPLATHISVTRTLDPPAEKAETAAFMARAMAEELQQQLTEKGLGCTRIVVGIETEKGDYLERVWRCETSLSVAGIVDRVRWQLDGWLNSATRPNAGVSRLLLTPDEVGPNDGRQYGFWGQESSFDTRADRAFTRIAAFAGATAVRVPLVVGGRLPDERVQLLAYAGNDRTALRSSAHAPWPGSLPSPLPALSVEWPVQVVDEHDELVRVSARGELSGLPTSLSFSSHRFVIEQWTGPWLFDERWWDAETQTRRACFQFVVRQGRAFLVEVRSGEWHITGVYD